MKIDETLNDYAWEDDCKKSYDLGINELKEKLNSIPKIEIGNCTLYNAPCEEIMPLLPRVEAIVTDPPYGLSFMNKAWDYDVPKKETWEHAYKLLSHGGHLLAFFGSRTYHRGAVQIEDAGFEIRDQIMWIYGSGFPKSLDVSKAIDKKLGCEDQRKITHYKKQGIKSIFDGGKPRPASLPASLWDGYGTALKPAHEPIVVARKPLNGTVAENVLNYKCGALNIDACRIEGKLEGDPNRFKKTDGGEFVAKFNNSPVVRSEGRWPANVIHDGSEEVTQHFSNDAARFFYCAKASQSERDAGCENLEEKKMGFSNGAQLHGEEYDKGQGIGLNRVIARKNIHPTVKPVKLMEYLCKLVGHNKATILDPFMGSGTTGVACAKLGFKFIGIEMNKEYFDIAVQRIKQASLSVDTQTDMPL